jgi:DNA polymerase-3 subunit beta
MVSVGTDGRKLVKYKDMTITSNDDDVKSVTIPAKPCKALLSMLKGCDTSVLFNDSALCVTGNDFALVTRLIDGKYPNYNAVIPTDNCKVATIQKDDIISALKRVLPMGNTSSELVALSLTQGMETVSTEDVDYSKSASENILCEYNDEDITIGFKGSILLQMLQITDGEKVRRALRNPSSAGIITEDVDSEQHEFIALVMPMMLG